MKSSRRLRFELHAQTRQYQRAIIKARFCIKLWLQIVQNPYIAFSTGKDSTCILHLIREQKEAVPAVYFDAGAAFPESNDVLNHTINLIEIESDESLISTLKYYGLAKQTEYQTMKSTVWNPIKQLQEQYNFDGMAYGLRTEESPGRLKNWQVHGEIFSRKRDKLVACQPIASWTYDDVWAFIVSNDLPYCKLYDLLWDLPESSQRLSYWCGETNRTCGRWAVLKKTHLDLFNKLANKIPETRCYT